jgi:hypothetical protein
MCGEVDEGDLIGQEILERFTVMAKMLGLVPGASTAPEGLSTSEGRAAYMEQLFRAGLTRALADATAADREETVDAIAAQAIAFARLAGFIAGQLPPEADLFRTVIEAVAAGHGETTRLVDRHRDAQAAAHGHHHGHDHDHDHDHHH